MASLGLEPNRYTGTTDRDELLARARRAALRLGIDGPGAVKLRPSGEHGAQIVVQVGGRDVTRTCESQQARAANFGALVQWLEDLARNAERGIETLGEALSGDGVALAVCGGGRPPPRGLARNDYAGALDPAASWSLVRRATERLRLDDAEGSRGAAWLDRVGDTAVLRIHLGSGRTIEKRSSLQRDARRNAAALALWLMGRARHHERGIEQDLARSFAAYLVAG